MVRNLRRFNWAGAACLAVVCSLAVSAQKNSKNGKDSKDDDARRPKLTLKAQPLISMSPSRVVLIAELVGGANDFEEFYCPTVEWDWDDGTQSGSTLDCLPFEPGKSEIKRRFTIEHVFRAGNYRVMFRLKRRDKMIAAVGVNIQVQPGLTDRG